MFYTFSRRPSYAHTPPAYGRGISVRTLRVGILKRTSSRKCGDEHTGFPEVSRIISRGRDFRRSILICVYDNTPTQIEWHTRGGETEGRSKLVVKVGRGTFGQVGSTHVLSNAFPANIVWRVGANARVFVGVGVWVGVYL